MKKDFPLLVNNPDLVYLDNAATTQKPSYVIEGVKAFLEKDYGNIHRGRYSLAEKSEELFWQARKKTAARISAQAEEIIFTANSTDSSNLLVSTLVQSGRVKKDDEIILTMLEHHASSVPRHMACTQTGATLRFVSTDLKGCFEYHAFEKSITSKTKIVVCNHVSNVTGEIVDIPAIKKLLPVGTLLIVDASQSIPHIDVNVQKLDCDFLFFTGHKLGAFTGIGVLYGKRDHLHVLTPSRGGGSAINSVTTKGFTLQGIPDKFEPGTPNLVGAVSLLKALEYLEAQGGYDALQTIETPLVQLCLQRFAVLEAKGLLTLLGPSDASARIGLFSRLVLKDMPAHELGQRMAARNICIRCGGQCAQPLHESLGAMHGSCRISLRRYNTEEDVRIFFDALEEFLESRV